MEPKTRKEHYLAKIAGEDVSVPEPKTRQEYYLNEIANKSAPSPLPEVTDDDNGDVLTVVNGAWGKAAPSGGANILTLYCSRTQDGLKAYKDPEHTMSFNSYNEAVNALNSAAVIKVVDADEITHFVIQYTYNYQSPDSYFAIVLFGDASEKEITAVSAYLVLARTV